MFAVVHVCDCRMSASGSFSVIFRFRVCWIMNFSVQPDCTAKQKKKTCYYILFSHENVGYRRVSVRALTFFAVLYWLNCRLLCAAYIVVFHFVVFLSLAPNFTADRLSLFHESQVRLVSFAFFFYSEGNCYTYFFSVGFGVTLMLNAGWYKLTWDMLALFSLGDLLLWHATGASNSIVYCGKIKAHTQHSA